MLPLAALVDDSRVESRVGDRVGSRVAGNTRPRVSGSTHPAGRRSRPGRMARCRRSSVAPVTTWAPVRVGCSVFLNNRYQDPTTGIFLSVDPLVAKTGEPYLYASGNPTTLSDPLGLCSVYSPTQGIIDDGRGKCQGASHATPKPKCGGGFVPTSCVSTMLPERYKKFIGLGDGEEDLKVEYHDRPVEPGERDLCGASPLACVFQAGDLKTIKNIAESSRVNTDGGDGTLGNGRRHVLLAALLTWQFGEGRARDVLEAHENIRDGQLLAGQEFGDLRMTDLINNELGITLGLQFSEEFGGAGPEVEIPFTFDDASYPATGFYTDEGLAAIEAAVLSDPRIVYFVSGG